MKKKYFIALFAALILILAGCSKEEAVAKEDTSVDALQQAKEIGRAHV